MVRPTRSWSTEGAAIRDRANLLPGECRRGRLRVDAHGDPTHEPDGRITDSRATTMRVPVQSGSLCRSKGTSASLHKFGPKVRVVPVADDQLAQIQLVLPAALGTLHVCIHQDKTRGDAVRTGVAAGAGKAAARAWWRARLPRTGSCRAARRSPWRVIAAQIAPREHRGSAVQMKHALPGMNTSPLPCSTSVSSGASATSSRASAAPPRSRRKSSAAASACSPKLVLREFRCYRILT